LHPDCGYLSTAHEGKKENGMVPAHCAFVQRLVVEDASLEPHLILIPPIFSDRVCRYNQYKPSELQLQLSSPPILKPDTE